MKILVIGGYGTFGKRLVNSFLDFYEHEIVIAGRSGAKLAKAKHLILVSKHKSVDTIKVDILSTDLNELLAGVRPEIVVNTAGPYQFQANNESYSVAKACLNFGCHYIDFADDRRFVAHFADSLNMDAKEKGVMLITGASTVPALTHAVIEFYQKHFNSIEALNFGISPGNQTERGQGTIASILSYTGKPFKTLIKGENRSVFGWQGLTRYDFGYPIGKRWMSHCEIPDLDLIPANFPSINTVCFRAGLEVSVMHIGLWILSWFTRLKLVNNWQAHSKVLTTISEWFAKWGSDCGGMFITLIGRDKKKDLKTINWQLVAEDGVGPNVPTISAEILINKIANGEFKPGARACTGLFSLEEFLTIAGRWGIYQKQSASFGHRQSIEVEEGVRHV